MVSGTLIKMTSVLPFLTFLDFPTKKHLWSGLSSWVLWQHTRKLKACQVDVRPWMAMCIPPLNSFQPINTDIGQSALSEIPYKIRFSKNHPWDEQSAYNKYTKSSQEKGHGWLTFTFIKTSKWWLFEVIKHFGDSLWCSISVKLTNAPCIDVLPTKTSGSQALVLSKFLRNNVTRVQYSEGTQLLWRWPYNVGQLLETWKELETSERRDFQLRNCLHQTVP